MATENKISILVSAVDQASKVLNNIGGSITDFAKKNEKAFTKMRDVGGIAFGAITAQAGIALKAFSESEAQMVRVDKILENIDYTGLSVDMGKAGAEARKFGTSLQSLSGIGDEMASESFAKLFQITKDVGQAQKLATLSADLSIAKSIDMDSATKLVSMALAGNTRALKEYGIVLDENATPMEALEELQKRVGGQAEAYGKTLEGQSVILRQSFGDMQEAIGGALAPAMSQLLATIQPVINTFVKWASDNPETVKNILLVGGAIAGLVAVVGTLGLALPAIVAGFTVLAGPIGILIAGIVALGIAWQTNFMDIQGVTHKVFDEIKAFWAVWGEDIMKGFDNVWETLKIATTLAFEILGTLFDAGFSILGGVFDIFKGIFTGNWSLMWEGLKTILSATWNAMKTIISTIGTAINTYVKTIFGVDIAQTFTDIWNSVYTTATTIFTKISDYIMEKVNWIMAQLQKAKDALLEIATLGSANTSTYNGARAVGGSVSPNTPYLVGERGPEIFMPTGSGRIVPNNQLGGGQSVNISFGNVSISNGMELEDLTNKIKSVIYNEHKFARLGY